ncbi:MULTISPECIES: AMP-binding protein [Sphingobium]|jgi:crotonobetaine/carnitine-CoA ligase|uniref:AMP-binding protein n=2 Tax=Sphingobium fuliginis (strain ATCC 27551) TaxID=336203 RepID=A0A292ZMC3_SPHSA|nr:MULTISPECIES: AMP-binding protein [Sphingobium]QDC39553.1 AMP-binding protein [Sphingobium fuliginis ATCC 27551]QOT73852.1 AMP-binding protein [Sphingobium fuliginis]RYL96841.1 long-chain fatty acid--CoA ligase [Sphingobium fuliginis]WDA35928.1 AMP-binding protein [Sphingobium sp. YC-XJ3]GAY24029.1 long-chain-fatty-acid--CoA ligase [Sphingobium fuliginis]
MYSGLSDQRRWTFPFVIEEQAAVLGDAPFVTMTTGEGITYRQLRDDAAQVAGMLAAAGARAGDRIALMLPSGLDFLRAWAGIGRLGATAVILNSELTGAFLAHPLADSAPSVLIVDAQYVSRLDGLDAAMSSVRKIFVAGADQRPAGDMFDRWRSATALNAPLPGAADIACIMYTSGTTGAPKGVLMPHAHCFLFGLGVVENLGVTADDHYYVCLPLSHANGLLMQLGATLIAGATATVRERFSASGWLSDLHRSGATVTNTLGAISAFVIAQPPGGRDRNHKLRAIASAPNHPDHDRIWRERFGIAEVLGGYGMTEINIPLYGRRGEARPGTCGRPYERFEVRIADPATDIPVGPGEVGEILVRPCVPYGFMAGYLGLPDRTVEAWRNLWFHTGDAGRMDADGYVTFVDRIKDCIRRRGENISATDIERTLAELPGVKEVAAFAVPSDIPGGEDEIMCAVVPHADGQIDPAALAAHARARMPRYAQPRYIEFLTDLPRTGTEKVKKADLRERGVTVATLDLQALLPMG